MVRAHRRVWSRKVRLVSADGSRVASLLEPTRRATRPKSPPEGAPRGERYGSAMLPRLPWLVLILIAAALLAVGADAISNDTWLGIAGGREVLQHGFGTANTWTRFGTHDWADQQWGAHLIFYGVWRVAGAAGLVTLNVALLAAGLGLCLRAGARRGSGPIWAALLLLLLAVICVGELVFVRTQSFSVLFFGLLLWLLGRDDGRLERRVLLALPLLVAVGEPARGRARRSRRLCAVRGRVPRRVARAQPACRHAGTRPRRRRLRRLSREPRRRGAAGVPAADRRERRLPPLRVGVAARHASRTRRSSSWPRSAPARSRRARRSRGATGSSSGRSRSQGSARSARSSGPHSPGSSSCRGPSRPCARSRAVGGFAPSPAPSR